MIKSIVCCCILLAAMSCAAPPAATSVQSDYGPTTKSKSDRAYELLNRQLAAEIDETTGGVRLVRRIDSKLPPFVVPTFTGSADSTPASGYIESRDEETWQYFGDSQDGKIGWRIVYCLYYNQLNVTYIVQNKSKEPLTGHVVLSGFRRVTIQPFNEDPSLNTVATTGTIRSDERTLKPDERINLATRWTFP